MHERPLFGDANEERILQIVEGDWSRFSGAAFVSLGRRAVWEAAVKEYAILAFYMDPEKLGPIFDLILERCYACPSLDENLERQQFIAQKLFGGIEIPGAHLTKLRIEARAKVRAEPKESRERREYQEWKANYLAGKLADKPMPVRPRK